MTVQREFASGGDDTRNESGSSCDGASCESQFDPNTGQRIPGYVAPTPPARLSTSGQFSEQVAHGDLAANRQARAGYAEIHGDGAAGITVGE
jgi:hypothetical protein